MQTDLIICFIDDSSFEHDLVKNEIAPFAKGLKFVQAYSFDEAVNALNGRIPGIFLLDLWGLDRDCMYPGITPKEELESIALGINTLDNVYDGIDTFKGDRINEYLKRLFSIVDGWRSLFMRACARAGQNNKYGIYNIGRVREYYPGVAALFYTRKSLISDAVAMINAGTDGLYIKPTGKNDHETRILTRAFAPRLIDSLVNTAKGKIENISSHSSHYIHNLGQTEASLKNLITCWKEFKNI
jgi:DNA-binding NarL/FixJ family response regulator